ncbi:MAG: methyltransferase [Bryobacter sp.]
MNLLWGKAVSTSLSALAKLGVPDQMHPTEPRSAEVLAAATHAHAPSLYRVLRMLASLGVFAEHPGQRFTLTPLGQCLRADSPTSLRGVAMMITDTWQMQGYEFLDHALRTGESGLAAATGIPTFEAISRNPAHLENFQAAMSNSSAMEGSALAPLLNFSGFQRLADVAGGHGSLLAQILHQNPHLEGILFDLPEVIAHAPTPPSLGLADRLRFESGNMFLQVPAACDAYILKHIIHDWDDARCLTVLRLIREQLAAHAPSHGRVFLVEMVMPSSPEPHPAKFLDIEMLAITGGGKERTEAEFAALFEHAGFTLVGIQPSPSPACLIEARLAA